MFTPFEGHEFLEHDFLVAGTFDRAHESSDFEDVGDCHVEAFSFEPHERLVSFLQFVGCWKGAVRPCGKFLTSSKKPGGGLLHFNCPF